MYLKDQPRISLKVFIPALKLLTHLIVYESCASIVRPIQRVSCECPKIHVCRSILRGRGLKPSPDLYGVVTLLYLQHRHGGLHEFASSVMQEVLTTLTTSWRRIKYKSPRTARSTRVKEFHPSGPFKRFGKA